MIGLATKAGALLSGNVACEAAIRRGKGGLLIIAEDSADGTKEKFFKLAMGKGVAVRLFGTCVGLGKYCGKDKRSVVLISGKGFEEELMKSITCPSELADYFS